MTQGVNVSDRPIRTNRPVVTFVATSFADSFVIGFPHLRPVFQIHHIEKHFIRRRGRLRIETENVKMLSWPVYFSTGETDGPTAGMAELFPFGQVRFAPPQCRLHTFLFE